MSKRYSSCAIGSYSVPGIPFKVSCQFGISVDEVQDFIDQFKQLTNDKGGSRNILSEPEAPLKHPRGCPKASRNTKIDYQYVFLDIGHGSQIEIDQVDETVVRNITSIIISEADTGQLCINVMVSLPSKEMARVS
ncbi:hypothetical protein H4219_006459 [Mycoemilia scoparia]|uniref:Uncharacterized protein n=1 Tax=Mycoemilia scoparia TaxID=417184 RepID=A0A9W7ZNA0_9FUNG|nr:hypothetical protein H4219_006459 [Mycoemilia scoparia]